MARITRPRIEALEERRLLAAIPIGGELHVSSYTTERQLGPAVAMDSTGDFVVAWQSYGQDGNSYGVYAQRYHATGAAQGSEFRVNTQTANRQFGPSVAMSPAGDFVITWSTNQQDDPGNDFSGVYAQRYDAAGAAQGSEFRVNTYTQGHQFSSGIAMDADGDFVIVWSSHYQDGSDFGVYAQRYDADGVAQGSEFRVNTYTTNPQGGARVAMDSDGDFVVVWISLGQDGSSNGVYAQRFSAAGVALDSEFRVNTYTTSHQVSADVAMNLNGDFVVAWHSNLQDGSSDGVYAQRYNAAGVAQGSEFRVNTRTTNAQRNASVAIDASGDFVVTWESYGQDGNGHGVYFQQYNSSGMARGGELKVNTYTRSHQRHPSVAVDSDGDFVVAWESNLQDGSNYGIYAQRYAASPVLASQFQFTTNPQRLIFSFDQDVSANFSEDDLLVENLSGGSVPAMTMLPYGTEGANTATFIFSTLLDDSNYRATLAAAGITSASTPMNADYLLNFFVLTGDANHDRIVNAYDLAILAINWLGTGKTYSQGDFDYDGDVDAHDLGMLGTKWNQTLAGPAPALPAPPTGARTSSRVAARTPTRLIDLVQ